MEENLYLSDMKERLLKLMGKILPFLIFILLIPLSLLYLVVGFLVSFIRKAFRQ